jgi:glycosyltransferase involved in cell wall biosynthesis
MSRDRAVVAFHAAEIGGPLRSLEHELRWLGGEYEVEVLLPASGEPAPAFRELGATVRRGPYAALEVPSTPLGVGRLALRARREVRWFRGLLAERRPRLALSVTSTLPAFLLAARLEGVPSLLWVGELFVGAGRSRRRELAGRALWAAESRLAAGVIACSETVARRFPPPAPVTTVLPGLGDSYADGDGPGFRSRHGLAADAAVIACVGNITRGRGQDVLLRAVGSLAGSRPGLRCVIEGSPFPRGADLAFSRELEELTRSLGLAGTVVRSAGTEEIADLYAAADVLVNPATTHAETLGRVAFEAGLAGAPSILTRVGAVPELHTDGATALLVSPGDPRALAGAIERLLDDRRLAARIAAGAAALAGRLLGPPERSVAAFRAEVERVTGSRC